MPNIYQRNGYRDRRDYLRSLAQETGVSHTVVHALAEQLGPKYDFDALPLQLDDHSSMIHFTQGEPL